MSKTGKSHYDTLKISPNATGQQIKSAYYKLSKKYHPDMNDSAEAMEQFRNVSEAYEVLGNLTKRKEYDRAIHNRVHVRPDIPIYQYSNVKRTGSMHPTSKVGYNFDEWTRAHYGDIFQKHVRRTEARKEYERSKINFEKRKVERKMTSQQRTLLITSLILVSVLFLLKPSYYFDYVDPKTVNDRSDKEAKK